MKLHAPAIPLFNVDPYFSVWMDRDILNTGAPIHWTGSPNNMWGTVTVDGIEYRFLGRSLSKIRHDPGSIIKQTGMEYNACSTTVYYENSLIKLKAVFTSPMLADDLYYASRPATYLHVSYESKDGNEHDVKVRLDISEELVLNKAGDDRVSTEDVDISTGKCVRIGSGSQKMLTRYGDDLRIEWGYLYLALKGDGKTGNCLKGDLYNIYAEAELSPDALFVLAYDDIKSIKYFEKNLDAYWKKGGKTITDVVDEAISEYDALFERCEKFSSDMRQAATEACNEGYADLLQLAYRQIMAGHKLVVDDEGNNLYISKECFSNGCAATVDVTYPSAPMYLLYNTELLKGMLRPILKLARSEDWRYDFAPHDLGRYPVLGKQAYGEGRVMNFEYYQMPVEECGNMIILFAAIGERENDYSFAAENIDLIECWYKYLVKYGEDPDSQLCTDDFAGKLSHNCNLSVKAIMGIAGCSKIFSAIGKAAEAEEMMNIAKKYVKSFLERAVNADGSYRLAFDRPDTFSLKYNAVWDKLWDTKLFADSFYDGEIERYKKEADTFGIPLDSRAAYTKSDWLHWVSCFGDKEYFCFVNDMMVKAYSKMRRESRVPLTDWYYADTTVECGFRHRTVQGGLFMKLLFNL